MNTPKKVAGFGWRHNKKLVCASYSEDEGDFDRKESLILTQDKLDTFQYCKRGEDAEPIYDIMPESFAITLYNVVFMYPKNITVLSRIGRTVVFNANFDRTK